MKLSKQERVEIIRRILRWDQAQAVQKLTDKSDGDLMAIVKARGIDVSDMLEGAS